jgi:hypothetical protein
VNYAEVVLAYFISTSGWQLLENLGQTSKRKQNPERSQDEAKGCKCLPGVRWETAEKKITTNVQRQPINPQEFEPDMSRQSVCLFYLQLHSKKKKTAENITASRTITILKMAVLCDVETYSLTRN